MDVNISNGYNCTTTQSMHVTDCYS